MSLERHRADSDFEGIAAAGWDLRELGTELRKGVFECLVSTFAGHSPQTVGVRLSCVAREGRCCLIAGLQRGQSHFHSCSLGLLQLQCGLIRQFTVNAVKPRRHKLADLGLRRRPGEGCQCGVLQTLRLLDGRPSHWQCVEFGFDSGKA
ncbi:hypothetical protein [Arenibaculum pallidiluteum]|uniref:hypothetical protein n=1 Tax=Arenibaculum pallidiluteum TaxID=2812559 RepID=UPI001A979222|nr:hypothetical protein [Arenibaculum pallidiluteum]